MTTTPQPARRWSASPPPSSSAVVAVMRGNQGKDTRPEQRLRSELHRRGFRYRKHIRPLPELRCHADIAFGAARVAVFLDGCFWHGCPEHGRVPRANSDYWQAKLSRNMARDRENDKRLAEAGWTVVRVWEHEHPSDAADRVAATLDSKRASQRLARPMAEPDLPERSVPASRRMHLSRAKAHRARALVMPDSTGSPAKLPRADATA